MNAIDKKIKKVESLINRLSASSNNLQYITRLKSLVTKLEDLYGAIMYDKRYTYEFDKYFGTARFGISYFERVCNSVMDYRHGNKPF